MLENVKSIYWWSSELEAAALEESAVQIWSCRYNRASLDEGNTTASHSQIYIQKPHKYTDLVKHNILWIFRDQGTDVIMHNQ